MEMAGELSVKRSWEALRSVIDPEIYQNIVDLGLVYGVDIAPERQVTVTMTLTTPHCPMGPQIIQNVEHVLYELGAEQVGVNIVWEPAWTPDAMTPELKKLLGIEPAEMDEPEPELVYEPPPPPAKKKRSILGWLFP